jgi:hypothetical protein
MLAQCIEGPSTSGGRRDVDIETFISMADISTLGLDFRVHLTIDADTPLLIGIVLLEWFQEELSMSLGHHHHATISPPMQGMDKDVWFSR